MRSQFLSLAAALAFSKLSLAQTYTDCNPTTNTSCPSDAALGETVFIDFTEGESEYFAAEAGTTMTYGDDGAEFIMTSAGLAATITSTKYIFFGRVELFLKAASGTGVISSFVMESDDLDEIDWEWLGGNSTVVETNYFGKGNTTTYDRATYPTVNKPQEIWHNYTIDWTSASITWYVDGTVLRTLLYADALGGKNFPQTPMRIKIGIWDGGSANASEGTVDWAGGYTDLSEAPFTMYVRNLTLQDYTTSGDEYTYGDMSGDYTSIVISGNATTEGNTTSVSYSVNSTVGVGSNGNATTAASSSASAASTTATSAVSLGYMARNDGSFLALVAALVVVYLSM